MISAYIDFHRAGYAQSIETFNKKGELVGGLYGVSIRGFFAGESMFYKEDNASKVALYYLVEYLRERKVPWIDCQVMTPLFELTEAYHEARKDPAFEKELQDQLREFAGRPTNLSSTWIEAHGKFTSPFYQITS